VKLERYGPAEWAEKAFLCESLYANIVSSDKPLYLKYHPHPDWEPLESRLSLPKNKDTDTIFLGLHPSENSVDPIRIRFNKGFPGDFVLSLGDGYQSFSPLERTASEQNPLRVFVESYPSLPQDRYCELRVAVPKQSTLYKIPVVILAVMPSKTLWIIKAIFTIIHFFPLCLAIVIATECRGLVHLAGEETSAEGTVRDEPYSKRLQKVGGLLKAGFANKSAAI